MAYGKAISKDLEFETHFLRKAYSIFNKYQASPQKKIKG